MEIREGCLLCGSPLICRETAERMQCELCEESYESNAVCEHGHYVCDACHGKGVWGALESFCISAEEKDPLRILHRLMDLNAVAMHGPEHHAMVACCLLAAYKNCGGEINLEESLKEAIRRGKIVPGGICGFWGSCGAAIGAGIFMSIAAGATPLTEKVWSLPNRLTSKCLAVMADCGGPRCCKRNSAFAILTAVEYAREALGISMERREPEACTHAHRNQECIKERCPFFT